MGRVPGGLLHHHQGHDPGRRDNDPTFNTLVPLYVCPQRGFVVLADRGHAILAFRPAAVRES